VCDQQTCFAFLIRESYFLETKTRRCLDPAYILYKNSLNLYLPNLITNIFLISLELVSPNLNMPNVVASIEYLQNLPLYKEEKPYWCMLTPRDGFDPDEERLDNLEFEIHDGLTITDMRNNEENTLTIDNCGFQVLSHMSKIMSFETKDDVDKYKVETMEMLTQELDAVFVKTYELRLRKNTPIDRPVMNIADPLLFEGPARGAHNG
jgi:hypothetical protein